ncbi:hypothetical protein B0T24DRAFT_256758 [Lasiosphaeria ovina]|uniref:Secreted protein n=1 Tax=Lasiosphaeria ovina TaxID=92902 RepID=A0AAE0N781_9PEZI|nr:hypothetical protein B0T24DRAFT_256758 [Lasiosphaeria ovina]
MVLVCCLAVGVPVLGTRAGWEGSAGRIGDNEIQGRSPQPRKGFLCFPRKAQEAHGKATRGVESGERGRRCGVWLVKPGWALSGLCT